MQKIGFGQGCGKEKNVSYSTQRFELKTRNFGFCIEGKICTVGDNNGDFVENLVDGPDNML